MFQFVSFRESFKTVVWRAETEVVAQSVIESIRAATVRDVSPEHSVGAGYDARCGYCWLGAGHTDDYHAAAILSQPL